MNRQDLTPTQLDLARLAYARWKHMAKKDVLTEMAILFHLAVKVEEVRRLEETR